MTRQKNRGNEKGQAIAKLIMEQYQPQNKEEMQDAIKDAFGPMLEAMLQGDIAEYMTALRKLGNIILEQWPSCGTAFQLW